MLRTTAWVAGALFLAWTQSTQADECKIEAGFKTCNATVRNLSTSTKSDSKGKDRFMGREYAG